MANEKPLQLPTCGRLVHYYPTPDATPLPMLVDKVENELVNGVYVSSGQQLPAGTGKANNLKHKSIALADQPCWDWQPTQLKEPVTVPTAEDVAKELLPSVVKALSVEDVAAALLPAVIKAVKKQNKTVDTVTTPVAADAQNDQGKG